MAGARFARPNHIYKNLPRLYYPLLKTHPRTPHFPSSFPPERFLRPQPQAPFALHSFSLYIAPSPEASGKSLYMWPGLASLAPTTYTKTCPAYTTPFLKPTHGRRTFPQAFPRNALRPPGSSSALNSFVLHTAPVRRPWTILCERVQARLKKIIPAHMNNQEDFRVVTVGRANAACKHHV